ncbi:MAG: hypothetical protein RIQ30_1620 [Pseudomonadota bacterium]
MPPRTPTAYQALDLNEAITTHLPLVKRIAYQNVLPIRLRRAYRPMWKSMI